MRRRCRVESNEAEQGQQLPDSEEPWMLQETGELFQQAKKSHWGL